MPVSFDSGTTPVMITNNSKMMQTKRGPVQADQLQQGDFVCVISGEPCVEITSVPVVT
jgi:hypothetical protein